MLGHVRIPVVEVEPDGPFRRLAGVEQLGDLDDVDDSIPGPREVLHLLAEPSGRHGELVAVIRDSVVEENAKSALVGPAVGAPEPERRTDAGHGRLHGVGKRRSDPVHRASVLGLTRGSRGRKRQPILEDPRVNVSAWLHSCGTSRPLAADSLSACLSASTSASWARARTGSRSRRTWPGDTSGPSASPWRRGGRGCRPRCCFGRTGTRPRCPHRATGARSTAGLKRRARSARSPTPPRKFFATPGGFAGPFFLRAI